MSTGYSVCIRGELVDDDGFEQELERQDDQAWCPDCGGALRPVALVDECYDVLGTRLCFGVLDESGAYPQGGGCGSLFSVQTQGRRVYLRRERIYRAEGKAKEGGRE